MPSIRDRHDLGVVFRYEYPNVNGRYVKFPEDLTPSAKRFEEIETQEASYDESYQDDIEKTRLPWESARIHQVYEGVILQITEDDVLVSIPEYEKEDFFPKHLFNRTNLEVCDTVEYHIWGNNLDGEFEGIFIVKKETKTIESLPDEIRNYILEELEKRSPGKKNEIRR